MSTDPRAGEAGTQVEPEILDELLSMRASIDNIDATLVYLLAERFKATQRVGVLKAKHQLPAADPAREKNQISRLKRLANEAQLDPEFAEKFLNFIIEEVIRHHQAISSAGLGSAAVAPGETADDAAAPHESTDR
ncbi:chorismate mutase [Nesterenkonia sp. E16_7]|uniref:chorismate mutase n=1 Tax=unclassified Nesterenkonia TaxID=2629769 RepID=UPI001A937699|nr:MULTISPECIES: chorismate mutase [unclassified Nesterenkonia]MBO0594335.1 chorismate mutase [Nesterenkonia sp. E16_10]MBO0598455.1 chorismate mutase [Nesterenkonia sp. E16_7]